MYDETILIKVPSDLKQKVKEKARLNCQNMSDYVRALVIKDLKEKE